MPNGYINEKDKFLPAVTTHAIDIDHPFIGLSDTPTTYSGHKGHLVSVNDGEDGTEFVNTLSGINAVTPTEDDHVVNKKYVDDNITAVISGTLGFCVESNEESSTTSSDYQDKVVMSRYFEAGDYIVFVSSLYSCSDTGVLFNIRAFVDDSITKKEQVKELYNFKYSDGAWHTYSGQFKQTFSEGNHTIKIQYHTSVIKTMYMKEAVILVNPVQSQ